MSTAEQIIAEHAVRAWRADGRTWCWKCGEFPSRGAHAAHVVAALTNAGKAIVELPEHPDEALEEHGITASRRSLLPITLDIDPAGVYLKHFSAKGARTLAAALLAAARVAEGGEHGEHL
ncbi:hypothetical protein 7S2_19 [uncultured Caudovirales phage]|uniref:Uncharacterized protein n=1 Tax=uncultured Caudovirales phage TaxID=2100421 RepID=A0A2H4J9S6_9CAUD|nr:hypothetical protein 7S2_19 [uncultured Caudovirales phage]